MSQHHVNPDLIHRTAWGNPLWNALHNLNITGLCLAGSIITALIWPLALPVCLLFTPGHLRDIHAATLAMPPAYAHDTQP